MGLLCVHSIRRYMHTLRRMQVCVCASATAPRPAAKLLAAAPQMTDAQAVATHTARVLAEGASELAALDAGDAAPHELGSRRLSPAAMVARWHQHKWTLQQAVVEALRTDRLSLALAYADTLPRDDGEDPQPRPPPLRRLARRFLASISTGASSTR